MHLTAYSVLWGGKMILKWGFRCVGLKKWRLFCEPMVLTRVDVASVAVVMFTSVLIQNSRRLPVLLISLIYVANIGYCLSWYFLMPKTQNVRNKEKGGRVGREQTFAITRFAARFFAIIFSITFLFLPFLLEWRTGGGKVK